MKWMNMREASLESVMQPFGQCFAKTSKLKTNRAREKCSILHIQAIDSISSKYNRIKIKIVFTNFNHLNTPNT